MHYLQYEWFKSLLYNIKGLLNIKAAHTHTAISIIIIDYLGKNVTYKSSLDYKRYKKGKRIGQTLTPQWLSWIHRFVFCITISQVLSVVIIIMQVDMMIMLNMEEKMPMLITRHREE